MAQRAARGQIVMLAYARYAYDPRIRREAEALVRRGRSVTILCVREDGEPREERINGVRVLRLPLQIRRGSMARYLYQYGAFVFLTASALLAGRRTGPVDAVHVHSPPDFLVLAAIGPRIRGRHVVLDLHEGSPELLAARFPGHRSLYALAAAVQRASGLLAHRIFVVNETLRDLLIERGLPREHITVLYNSPSEGNLPPVAPAPAGLPSGNVTKPLFLVYAGGINQERDLDVLIRAVARIKAHRPIALDVYGPGPRDYEGRLRGLIRELDLANDVSFRGILPPDEVLRRAAASDVGVITYARNPHTEIALSSRAFEWIALGKPLVVADLRGMRLVFEGAALFYSPGDVADLAKKILLAAEKGPEIQGMRERARALYAEARWEIQEERLAAVYASFDRAAAGG